MSNGTVEVHLCTICGVNMQTINNLLLKQEYHIIVKLLKLVYVFAIVAVPIHDVATREKRLLGSELACVHFYLILYRVPKYSTKHSLPLCNPFWRDQLQLVNISVIRLRELMLPRHSLTAQRYIQCIV